MGNNRIGNREWGIGNGEQRGFELGNNRTIEQ